MRGRKPSPFLFAAREILSGSRLDATDRASIFYQLREIFPENPDLIFCGRQSVDGDTAQVGPMLAQKLSIPVITNVDAKETTLTSEFAEKRNLVEKDEIVDYLKNEYKKALQ